MIRKPVVMFFALILLLISVGTGAQEATPTTLNRASEGVLQALSAEGSVRVIIELNVPLTTTESARRPTIDTLQNTVLSSLSASNFTLIRQFEVVPALSGVITLEGVRALQANPAVKAIIIDERVTGFLDEGRAVIQSDTARTAFGLDGDNVRVAVVDSGVDVDHPDLEGSIVAQKCFATNTCEPGNINESDNAQDEHGHGTHVTGIVTSSGAASEMGVAPEADIVAVRVLDENNAGFTSDIVAGLEWINDNQATLNVDVVNLSLGTFTRYTGNCDTQQSTYASIFQQLANKGVVVIAASGNAADANQLSAPACNSNVIAVGATYDASGGTIAFGACTDNTRTVDQIACFSNAGVMLDVLAPGAVITSSALNGTGINFSGTSMASPMTAGVAALMLDHNPNLIPAEVEMLLEQTGLPLLDSRNGQTYPRVNALNAVTLGGNHDDVSNAIPVGSLPFNTSRYNSAATTAGTDPVPTDCVTGVNNTVWYTYIPSEDTSTTFLVDADFDVVISVWTGTSPSLTSVVCADSDSGSESEALVGFNASAGSTYLVMVAGENGESGLFELDTIVGQYGAPEIASTSPADGAVDAITGTNITITFDRPVNVDTDPVTLDCGTVIPVDITPGLPAMDVTSITLDPQSDLPQNTLCTVTVSGDKVINTLDSQVMAGMPSFSFSATRTLETTSVTVTPNTQFGDAPLSNPLMIPVPVSDVGLVDDVTVTLNVNHNFLGDVIVGMQSPGGDTATLINGRGAGGDDLINTVFDDSAALAISSGTPPFTGTFRPETPLSVFDNTAVNGDWNFNFEDTANGTDGTVDGITLTITYVQDVRAPRVVEASLSSAGVMVTFDEPVSLTTAAVTLECPSEASVPLTGLPISEETTITLSGTLPTGESCTVTVVAAETTDAQGNQLDGNNDGTAGDDYTFTDTVTEATPTPTATDTPTETTEPTVSPTITVTDDPTTPTATATTDPNATPTNTPTVTATTDPNATPTPTHTPDIPDEPGELGVDGDLNAATVLPEFLWVVNPNDFKPWYGIFVYDSDATLFYNVWLERTTVCQPFTGVCRYTPTLAELPGGFFNDVYTWEVQSWEDGMFATVGEDTFVVSAPVPALPLTSTVDASTGIIALNFPNDPGVSWLNVYVGRSDFSETYDFRWYPKTEATCAGSTCTLYPRAFPPNGNNYVVYLQTWGAAGYNLNDPGIFSGPFTFSLSFPLAGEIEPLTTTIDSSGRPTFTWNKGDGTTWYEFWVGTAAPEYDTLYLDWLWGLDLGCNSGTVCTFTPPVTLQEGMNYEWWIRTWGPGGLDLNSGIQGWNQAGAFTADF
ncbi:MAG: hypothetical protein OHK0046_09670 [Anaerolineae bacterium]